jgi:hypothetical protein
VTEFVDQSAQVIGLEPHLTVPSRGDKTKVDLWFALKRSAAGQVWEEHFQELTSKPSVSLLADARVETVPFTVQNGWIVARGVDRRTLELQHIESAIRELVQLANEAVIAHLEAVQAPAQGMSTSRATASLSRVITRVRDYVERRRVIDDAIRSRPSPLAPRAEPDYNTNSGAHFDATKSVA